MTRATGHRSVLFGMQAPVRGGVVGVCDDARPDPVRPQQRADHDQADPIRARFAPLAAGKDDKEKKGGDGGAGQGTAVITRTKTQTRRPSMYRVLLLNDDYTPMEFVVAVLKKYFNKGPEEATRIMLHVHQHGVGECGVFTYEVAETKVTQVMDYARKHQHPLQCIMEKK
ncbi:ATP-dependent Clp protease adaptor protein ClpS [Methylocella silvestris BL2]|uniref:ATP-dependent Clp protease adapter protein ClpS n=1 Tax=Methylocella silvestris (strain DSM 15510 / CIP 108128 / LMG 27833 / NCIMB 13906 / BL2) TaxID=395965 RepID=B8EPD1_METSB|nr:ATP-dependent Clp protease adaptor protein ClpS [Methylocella silvestris BL2]